MSDCTIIIPHYNAWEYLPRAIECAKNQTVKCDIIVIDDCSVLPVSKWGQYLDEIDLQGITFIKTPKKLNWGPTMNLGFEYATTDYCLVLNPDDILLSNAIEEMLKLHPGIVFPQPVKLTSEILNNNYLSYCAIIPRYVWGQVGGFIDHWYCDWDFWCKIYAKYPTSEQIDGTKETYFEWTQRERSVTNMLAASGQDHVLRREIQEKYAYLKERPKVSWERL